MYALSKQNQNKQIGKYASVHKAVILSKIKFLALNFFMQMLNVHIMKAKYQMASVKALVQVDFPVH